MQHVTGTHFDLDWLCVIPLWLACAIWAMVLMRQRGHPIWKGLLMGLAFGPMGVLWVLTVARASARRPRGPVEHVACRSCSRPVSRYAPACPHCGYQWPAGPRGVH